MTSTGGVVVGADSSTQSCKVLVLDAASGATLAYASAPHPDGTAVDPWAWVEALRSAWSEAGVPDRGDVIGVGVAAQQHGLVAVDEDGEPVHDALLWNDVRSAGEAEQMLADLGADGWLDAVGVVPLPAITLTKLAWLRRHVPQAADRIARVMLPHDWLVLQLTGEFTSDRSDASGTGYFDAATNRYRPDLIERYFGALPELPRVLGPDEQAGRLRAKWGSGAVPVSAGAGDNAAAALGLGLAPGEVVASVGTLGTVFTRSAERLRDPSGLTAGFADATGEQLPLLCTLNAARVLTATAELLAADLAEFENLALAADPSAGGLTMLPYFDGERTPNLPLATGELHGLTRGAFTRENLARTAVLAVANSLADCLDMLRSAGTRVERVLLVGGGAKSRALRSVLADTLGTIVEVPEPREYVAIGAAHQAAWAATGSRPSWPRQVDEVVKPAGEAGIAEYRERYIRLRAQRVAAA